MDIDVPTVSEGHCMTIEESGWTFDEGRWTKIAMQDYSSLFDPDPNELDESDQIPDREINDEGPLWVIDSLADGTFSVFESHHSLTDRKEPFGTLAEAMQFCEAIDHEIQCGRSVARSSNVAAAKQPELLANQAEPKQKRQRDLPFG